jgi:4-hydroxy-2-oxoheptanedioate aldolase
MRTSRVKAKLRKNEPVLMTALHVLDPQIYEMVSLLGFDGIWLDMEHHPTSVETAATLTRAARVGASDVMIRPAKEEYMRIGRMLEIGAQGIMYPRCSGPDEAREVVKWSKFAPLGQRGFDGGNADMPYCSMTVPEYTKQANDETITPRCRRRWKKSPPRRRTPARRGACRAGPSR